MGNAKSAVMKQTNAPGIMPDFSIDKFLGTWYEIAYSITDESAGTCNNMMLNITRQQKGIFMENSCIKDGVISSTSTSALVPDLSSGPSAPNRMNLIYRIAGKKEGETILQEKPFWIYWTDYKVALVGNPKGNFWIMSREPTLSFCVFKDIKDAAVSHGLNVSKLTVNTESLKDCGLFEDSSKKAILVHKDYLNKAKQQK